MKETALIIKSILKQKTAPLLLALQIALTLAILANTSAVILDKYTFINRDSGIDIEATLVAELVVYKDDFPYYDQYKRDIETLKAEPSIISAMPTSSIPLSGIGGWMGVKPDPNDTNPESMILYYFTDENAIDALGLEIIAGEAFTELDIDISPVNEQPKARAMLLSKESAIANFGSWQDAPGKTLYWDDDPFIIKGVYDKLQAPWIYIDFSFETGLVATVKLDSKTKYMIRCDKDMLSVCRSRTQQILSNSPGRALQALRPLEEIKNRTYYQDIATNNVMMTVVFIIMGLTLMSIIGQMLFSIQKRRRQIGIRRALGVSKWQTVEYFLIETLIIVSVGVLLGLIAAIGLNMLIIEYTRIPKISLENLLLGAVGIYIATVISCVYPANKAASIDPAIATKTG